MADDILNKNISQDNIPESLKKGFGSTEHKGTSKVDYTLNKEEDLFGKTLPEFKQETNTEGFNLSANQIQKGQKGFGETLQKNITRENDIEAYTQSTLDKVGNGVVKMGGRIFTSIAGATVGTVYGIGAWIKDGEFRSFYDNDFQDGLDGINDYLADEFEHHYTSSTEDWEIGNFIFDKVFDGLGFAIGAVASGMLGGAATSAVTKGLGWSKYLKAGAVKNLKNLHKTNASTSKIQQGKLALDSRIALSARLGKIPQTAVSMTTGAVYESGVEARHTFDEIKESLIKSYTAQNGKAPEGNDLKEINTLAGQSANGVFAANMILVGGSNFLQFGKHLGLDYRDVSKLFGKTAIAKEVEGELVRKGSKVIRGIKSTLAKPVVESQEEMLQSVISKTGTDYTLSKYNNEGKADVWTLLNSSIKSFKDVYSSKEGWEEGLIGAIIGGMGVPTIGTKKSGKKGLKLAGGIRESVVDLRESENGKQQIIDIMNTNDTMSSMKNGIVHSIRDTQLEKGKDAAIMTESELDYKNAQDEQFHSYITSRIEAGMVDSVYDDIQSQRDIPLEDFKKSFGINDEIKYTESDRNKQLDSFERRAKSIEESTRFVESTYANINPEIREALVFNHSMINRLTERKESIAKEIDDLTDGYFTSTYTTLNQTSKGERLTVKEVFAGLPTGKKVMGKDAYTKLYKDYVALEDRSKNILENWTKLTTTEGQDEFESKVKKAQKEAGQDKVDRDKARAKAQTQADKETELEKAQALQKETDAINPLDETITSVTDDTETTHAIPLQDIGTLTQNINNVKSITDIEELTSLINSFEGHYNELPKTLQRAIESKKKQLAKKNAANKKQIKETNRKHNINKGTEETPPLDITNKGNDKLQEKITDSNRGTRTEGTKNEEMQTESKGVSRIGNLLVNAFNSVAVRTRKYKETTLGITNVDDELDENASHDLLSSDHLNEDAQVDIKLYKKPTLVGKDGELITNEEGPNQIMEVIYADKVVGYIHDLSYITTDRVVAQYNGLNNLDLNLNALSTFRDKAYTHLQTNESMSVKVLSKTPGQILIKANGKYDSSLKDTFKDDKRPKILTVKASGLYIGNTPIESTILGENIVNNFEDNNSEEDFYEKYKGATVVAVPSAAKVNGETQYILSLVRNGALKEATLNNKPVTPIISEILNAYLTEDADARMEVFNKYDIKDTAKSVEAYLSNFMYLTSDSTSKHYFYIGLDTETGKSKIRFSYEGTILVLDKSNNKNLKERLDNSLVSLNLAKLDTIVNKGKKASIKTEGPKVNYMDFILDNVYTNFIGHNIETSKGKSRTYVANPIVSLDIEGIVQTGIEPKVEDKRDIGLMGMTPKPKEGTTAKPTRETNSLLRLGKKNKRGPRKSPTRQHAKSMLIEGMDRILDKNGSLLETQATHEIVESLKTVIHGLIQEDSSITVDNALSRLKTDLNSLKELYASFGNQDDISIEDIDNGALSTTTHNKEVSETYELVLDNFTVFTELAFNSLASINYVISKQSLSESVGSSIEQDDISNEGINEHLDGGVADNVKTSYDEGSNFLRNPIDSLSAQVKMMLSTIPSGETNLINLDTYYSLDTVYGALLDILSNRTTDTIEGTIAELTLHTIEKPYLYDVIDMLEGGELSTEDINKFHQNIKNNYLEHEIIVRDVVDGIETFKVIKANRSSVSSLIVDDWLDNTNKAKVFKDKDGKVVIDKEYVNDILIGKKWKAIIDSKYSVGATQDFLEAMGIRMSTEALQYMVETSATIPGFSKQKWESMFTSDLGVFKTLKDSFEFSVSEDINPLKTERYIKSLSRVQARFTENLNTNSFRNAEGKTIFSYINPTWIVDRFYEFVDKDGKVNKTNVQKLLDLPYSSQSTWLNALKRGDETFLNHFGISVTDTIRTKGDQANKFSSLSSREQTVATINLFINQQQGKNPDSRIGKFIVAKSDKHVLHIVSATRHNTDSTTSEINTKEFGENDKDALINLVRGEYARILDAQKKKAEGVDYKDFSYKTKDGEITQGYNPFQFYLFEGLNHIAELYNEDGTLVDISAENEELMWGVIKDAVIKEETKTTDQLKADGIIEGDKLNFIDNKYIEEHGHNPKYFVRDYVINNMIATAEYHIMFQGDVATAFKGSVKGTFANMFKRLAKDIAPSTRAAKHQGSSFNKYKQIFLKDALNGSVNLDQLKELYGESSTIFKEYSKIQGTDAQEITTLEEHLEVMYHYGRLTDEQYKTLISKAKKGSTLSKEELTTVLQPMKPIYVGNQYMLDYGVDMPIYIKSSSFPLVPQLVKGTEFEKLERVMRKHGVSRAVFETGVKLGAYKTIDAWNKTEQDDKITDGTFNEKVIDDAVKDGAFLELNRDYFGIQQDVPYDSQKSKILEGSQLMKLIQMGIKDEGTIQEFNDLHMNLVEEGYQNLLTEIGFDENEDGDIYTPKSNSNPLEKLQTMLLAELMDRGSYNINDVKSLDLNKEGTDFKIPIWSSPKAAQYESLLNSLISKKVLRQKMPGKSYVLGTEEGWLGNSSEITKVYAKQLQGTSYDSKTGLKPQRIGYTHEGVSYEANDENLPKGATKVVFPAQVLISNPKIKKDSKKGEAKGLKQNKLVGYRIPTQDLNSMSAMEVVGYLPDYMADLIIAPKDFVIQMGSDFDIDKLYVHRWHENEYGAAVNEANVKALYTEEYDYINDIERDYETQSIEEYYNQKLSQNKIMDIYWDTLVDPANLERVLAPLGFGTLPEVAKKINDIQETVEHHPLSPIYQMKNYQNGNAGKFGVAVTSIASTTNALIQASTYEVGIGEDKNFAFKIGAVTYNATSFKGVKTLDGKSNKADVISAFQSASVDNIKELLINTINYNKYTHNAFVSLAYLGLDEDYISLLLAQPIIKEYVKTIDSQGDSLSNGVRAEAEADAYSQVQAMYEDIAITDELLPKDKHTDTYREEVLEIESDWNEAFTAKELLSNMSNVDALEQIKLLHKFQKLSELGKDIGKVARALQPSTSGVGQNRLAAKKKLIDAELILSNGTTIINADTLLGNVNAEEGKFKTDAKGNILFTPTTIAGQGIDILRRSNNLWDKYFEINTVVSRLASAVAYNRGSKVDTFTEKELGNFSKFIKSYGYSADLKMYFGEDPTSYRERLFYGGNSIAHRWDSFKDNNPGNWLARRIITRASISKTKPSTISYQSNQAGRTDDVNNTNSLIEMLYSNDPIAVKLAEDTIAYTYLRGGNQDAKSLLKFIPNTYLHALELGEDVKANINQLATDAYTSNAIAAMYKQYYQHYPYHADIKELGTPTTKLEDGKLYVTDGGKYVSAKVDKIWKLYERTNQNKEGFKVYKEIDTLGSSEFVETQYGNLNATSTIEENKTKATIEKETIAAALIEETNLTDSAVKNTDKKINTTAATYNIESGMVTRVLSAIASKSGTSEANKKLVNALSRHIVGTSISLGNTVKEHNADGTYQDGAITIDKNLTDHDEFIRVVLHESMHGAISSVLTNPITEIEKQTVASLNAVLSAAKKSNDKFSNKNGLSNIHEFVSELMTDVQFQRELASVNFSKDKSLLDRIVELFANLFSTSTGTEITNASIESVLSLLNETSSVPQKGTKKVLDLLDKITNVDFAKLEEENRKANEAEDPDLLLSPVRDIKSKYFAKGEVTHSVTILNDIANSKHVLAPLAKHLIPFAKENNTGIILKDSNINNKGVESRGVYFPQTKHIEVSNVSATEETILHEILHALSYDTINSKEHPAFDVMYRKAKEVLGDVYVVSNKDEFLVGLFTNANLIEILKDTEAVPGLKDHTNLFTQLMDYMLSLFDIHKSNTTLYTQAFAVATNILEEQRQGAVVRNEYNKAMAYSLKNNIFEYSAEADIQEMRKNC